MRLLGLYLAAMALLALLAIGCSGEKAITEGDTVKVRYVGKLEDGMVFDSSKTGEPLEFTVGSGQLIPGFDQGVMGLKVGDTKTIMIPSDSAYGPVNPEAIFAVPRSDFPEEMELVEGQQIQKTMDNGRPIQAKILEIREDSVVIDMNHPLAGQTLIFDIEVVEISSGI